MNTKRNKKIGQFIFAFGICGMIAGAGLTIFGDWQGIFGLLSGALIAFLAFVQNKESKNTNE